MVLHALAVYFLAGWFVLPHVVQRVLAMEVSQAVNRDINLESLEFNPLSFVLRASGLSVGGRQGEEALAGFRHLDMEFDLLPLLVKQRFTVKRFVLDGPVVRLSRDSSGLLNIADLLPKPDGQEPPEQPGSWRYEPPEVRFALKDIRIKDGTAVFDDAVTGMRQEVNGLNFAIDSLVSDQSGLSDLFSTEAILNESKMTLAVKADLFGPQPEAQARLTIQNVVFKHYMPYFLPLKHPVDLTMDEAGILVRAVIPRADAPDQGPRLESEARLSGVALESGGQRMFSFSSLQVQDARVSLETAETRVEKITLTAPTATMTVDAAGSVDLVSLFETKAAPKKEAVAGDLAPQPTVTTSSSIQPGAAPPAQAPGQKQNQGQDQAQKQDQSQSQSQAQDQGQAPARAPAQENSQAQPQTQAHPPAQAPAQPPRFSIAHIVVKDGAAHASGAGLGFPVAVTGIGAEVTELDISAGRFGSFGLQAQSDLFSTLSVSGSGGYAPLDITGKALLEGLDLARPAPLLKRFAPKLLVAGKAKAHADFTVTAKGAEVFPAVKAGLELQGLKAGVEGQSGPFLTVNTLAVTGLDAAVAAKKLTVGQVQINGGSATLARNAKGELTVVSALFPESGAKQQAAPGGKPWQVALAQARMSAFGVDFSDEQAKSAVRLDVDELTVGDYASGQAAKPVNVAVKGRLDRQGTLDISGTVTPEPFAAALNVAMAGVVLPGLARFAPDSPVEVRSGKLGVKGKVAVSPGPKDSLAVSYNGDVSLAAFRLARPGAENAFFTMAGLHLTGAAFQLSPPSLAVSALAIDQPWTVVTLGKDHKYEPPIKPVQAAAQARPQPQGKAGGASAPFSYSIGKLDVRGAMVDIIDNGFDPLLWTRVSEMRVSAAGVKPETVSPVSVSMNVGATGKFTAEGKAGYVGGAPVLDVRAAVENMDLGEMSPVSRQYTGFPITRGKLKLGLDYKIDSNSLDLKNKIVVMGIQLGQKSVGADGKSVPLDLAVSLLSDSKGVISLDIPVTGSPDQAKADLKQVISTALAGAFTKILFSPLAFLNVASQGGGGGETAVIAFAPGSAELSPEAQKTLSTLAQAVAARPRLSLEVLAWADPEAEVPGSGKPPKPLQPGDSLSQSKLLDLTKLAAQRRDAVMAFLTGPGALPPERVFPISADPLAPPKEQGQPGHRAQVRLRF